LTPLQAIDFGTALSLMLEDDSTASETFELYGPTNYSMAEIADLVDKEIYKHRRHINIPKRFLKPMAKYLNQLIWWKTTSADEVEREFIDQQIDPKAKTFKDLGMEPAELRNYTFHYLASFQITTSKADANQDYLLKQGYRSSAFYDLPPATEREKREEKKYLHVIDDQ